MRPESDAKCYDCNYKWSKVTIGEGEQREQELEADVWKDMIAAGCGTARFEDSYESAWGIIGSLGDKHQAQVRLAHEIVNSKLRLDETQAGIALNTGIALNKDLKVLIKSQKEIRRLRELARNQNSKLAVQEMNEQLAEIEERIRQTSRQLRKMKTPFTRRVRLLFRSHG